MGNFFGLWVILHLISGVINVLCVALRLDSFILVKLQIQILTAIDKLLVLNSTESFHLVAVFHPSRSRKNAVQQSTICHFEIILCYCQHEMNVGGHLLLPFVPNENNISQIEHSYSGKI